MKRGNNFGEMHLKAGVISDPAFFVSSSKPVLQHFRNSGSSDFFSFPIQTRSRNQPIDRLHSASAVSRQCRFQGVRWLCSSIAQAKPEDRPEAYLGSQQSLVLH